MMGFGAFYLQTVINPYKKGFFFSSEILYSKSCNYIYADKSKWDRPGWPLTFSTLHFDLCALTSTHPLPLRCCVFALICSFLMIYIILKIVFFFLFVPVSGATVVKLQSLNEECAQKPWTERAHSEGTSANTTNTALRLTSWITVLFLSSFKFVHGEA